MVHRGTPELPGNRLAHILALLSTVDEAGTGTRSLCEVAADVTGMSGAGIMLLSEDAPRGSLCSTNSVTTLLEDLQYTLGEGPCVDAHQLGVAVLEPDLAEPASPRWPAFAPAALDAGVRAVFGFPIRIGAARLGALDLYSDQPEPLNDGQYAYALAMADVAARAVLTVEANAQPGSMALEADLHFVVHQAAGMVSVQLGVTVGEALILLRAHAFSNDRLVDEVARDVVNRELRFGPDTP